MTEKSPLILCLDSDGSIMDSMTFKHERFFAPFFVKEWGLHRHEKEAVEIWLKINLSGSTRGVNRFLGLALTLKELNERVTPIAEVGNLMYFCSNSSVLSEESLKREIEKSPDIGIFKKALFWSEEVNRAAELSGTHGVEPFKNAPQAIEKARKHADIAIISGAAEDTVRKEWKKHGLLKDTDLLFCQEHGSKKDAINSLLSMGYSKDRLLFCGDAMGDLAAAEACGVYFYPILYKKENESLSSLEHALALVEKGEYASRQQENIRIFKKNLNIL